MVELANIDKFLHSEIFEAFEDEDSNEFEFLTGNLKEISPHKLRRARHQGYLWRIEVSKFASKFMILELTFLSNSILS